jgi:geranylgeranyl diphosphate synthase type I
VTIDAYLERYLPMLEAELKGSFPVQDRFSAYYGMMRYHMGWLDETFRPIQAAGGKRLRPVLCMLACEAVGGQVEHALPAAAAVELLHNFSLIHDDIEDNSPMRRHRKTVWTLWGLAQGINCGDGLFAIAILALGRLYERGVPAERVIDVQRIFTQTCLSLTEGQFLDMGFEDQLDVTLDLYLSMIRRKTASLISCSARLGALLGGAFSQVVEAYAGFGENLGLAFQVIDDILGIWGQEARTGKSACTDILARKKTLPIVYALEDPDLRAIYAQEVLTEEDVERVLAILERRQAREFAKQYARQYSTQALDLLDRTGPETPARQAMRGYVTSLLGRTS